MNPKEIRELIELVSRSDFSEFEMEREGFKIKLVRQRPQAVVVRDSEAASPPAGSAVPAAEIAAASADSSPAAAVSEPGVVEVRSPIVGTFYRAPSPDSPPFVEIGSRVKKGQVLCIVEAMKVMNEIESELDAEIVEVPPASGQPVEFGEVLFRLRPLD